MTAVADTEVSVTEVAITSQVEGVGTAAGAMYIVVEPLRPLVVITEPQPVAGDTDQVTPAASLVVTVMVSDPLIATFADVGLTETVMTWVMVMTAEADLVVSVTEVATTLQVAGEGTAAGAV